MTDLQRNTLFKQIGLQKSYGGRNLTITKVVPGEEIVTVFTTVGNMNFEFDEIDVFINALGEPLTQEQIATLNIPDVATVPQNSGVMGYSPNAENIELKSILMNTIKDIRSGACAPEIGKAIFNGASTMIGLQKVELQMMQMSKKK